MLETRKQVGESDMANAQTDEPTRLKPLRLWPGVVIVVLMWLARFVVPYFAMVGLCTHAQSCSSIYLPRKSLLCARIIDNSVIY